MRTPISHIPVATVRGISATTVSNNSNNSLRQTMVASSPSFITFSTCGPRRSTLSAVQPFQSFSGFARKVQVAMENAVEEAEIDWPHNCLRHSFCSHAVALHGFTWTSLQADHFGKNVEGSISGSRYEIRSRRLLRHPRFK